jgi:hypothetical protein
MSVQQTLAYAEGTLATMEYGIPFDVDIDKISRHRTGISFRHPEIGNGMNQDWDWKIQHGSRTEIRTTGDGTVNQEDARSIAWWVGSACR